MARKSRKHSNQSNTSHQEPKTVGYIRLSVVNKDRTCSVENQKAVIKLWAAEQKLPVSHFYIDEGVSGFTFRRSGFNAMLQDMRARKIDCVIVKDLSRLGRDHLSIGYYIEEIFPLMKVRLVSVNDHFDTIDGITNRVVTPDSRIRIPMVNAFNEQISKDIKKKVEVVLDMKAQQGMFIGPRAPFGYKKSEENRFCIIPDSAAAEIVVKIFELAVDGTGLTAIVRYLNEHRIPTPIQYARANGLMGNYDDGNGSWNTRSVKYILTNRTYTGMLVQGKEKRTMIGTHEPLVDSKTFETIQKSLQAKSFNLVSHEQMSENILKGKVICGCCGGKMQRKRGTNHADWHFFICNTNNRLGVGRCSGMYIREEDIFSAIYCQLKMYLKEHSISIPEYENRMNEFENMVLENSRQYEAALNNSMRYYERFVMDEINMNEFQTAKDKMHKAKAALEETKKHKEQYEKQYQDFKKLSKTAYKELPLSDIMDYIEMVLIYEGKNTVMKWR